MEGERVPEGAVDVQKYGYKVLLRVLERLGRSGRNVVVARRKEVTAGSIRPQHRHGPARLPCIHAAPAAYLNSVLTHSLVLKPSEIMFDSGLKQFRTPIVAYSSQFPINSTTRFERYITILRLTFGEEDWLAGRNKNHTPLLPLISFLGPKAARWTQGRTVESGRNGTKRNRLGRRPSTSEWSEPPRTHTKSRSAGLIRFQFSFTTNPTFRRSSHALICIRYVSANWDLGLVDERWKAKVVEKVGLATEHKKYTHLYQWQHSEPAIAKSLGREGMNFLRNQESEETNIDQRVVQKWGNYEVGETLTSKVIRRRNLGRRWVAEID
ncbi:hypothetical protein C8F04DRAFT_1340785 [Mycena alexandri]|uniref:Uncharacterized protein n=1 Tax=Mycena alexandri TaxID=1745969 RepID=A0AAD6SXU3_9AGAR|nr:hypothetical protein C8F04DRAFT_1340785 [Mycena alexandri]